MDFATPQIMAVAYGLGGAASWGAGDFSGGLATRRTPVLMVLLISQVVGSAGLVLLIACLGASWPGWWSVLYGAGAGVAGASGIVALYTALSRGSMGVAAPLSAVLTALLPVLAAAWMEGFPPALRIAGMGLGFAGIWLLTYRPGSAGITPAQFWLCLGAGVGFGLFFIGLDAASQTDVLWPLLASRIASMSLTAPVCLATKSFRVPGVRQFGLISLCGLLDTAGNGFFVLACQTGSLDMAAVLTSLYPASTVLLASAVLRERLKGRQWLGVAMALAALVFLSL